MNQAFSVWLKRGLLGFHRFGVIVAAIWLHSGPVTARKDVALAVFQAAIIDAPELTLIFDCGGMIYTTAG